MKKGILFVFLVFAMANCKNDDGPNCEAVACTESFDTIYVEVKDSSGMPFVLDDYHIIDSNSGNNLRDDLSQQVFVAANGDRLYPIYNDSFVSVMRFENRALVFKGFIDNQEVVTANYLVTSDCCHVSLVSGNRELIVN